MTIADTMYRIDDALFPEVVTKVRLISTETCTSCPSIRRFLEQHNIAYEEIHMEEATADELEQIKAASIMSAPVLFVNDMLVAAGGVQRPVLGLIKARYSREAADVAA